MIEPNGPLPPVTYWRRRVFAAGAGVLAVALLAVIIGGLVEADDQQPVRGTAGTSNLTAASSRSSAPAPNRQTARPNSTATAGPRATSGAPGRPTAKPAAAPSGQPQPTGSQPAGSQPAPPTTKQVPPGPPQPCPDAVVKVTGTPAEPSYPVGQRPLLRLELVNVGSVPCTRDVSRKLREIVVTSADGATRLWSSNDCYNPPEPDVRTMQPNQALTFSLNWAGRTSAPGCPVDRKTLPAGTYQVVGKLGGLTGAPTPLVLT